MRHDHLGYFIPKWRRQQLQGEKTMNIEDLSIGDLVDVQIDNDPTVEHGMVVYINDAKTMARVYGKDPDEPEYKQGFLYPLRSHQILKVTSKCYRSPHGPVRQQITIYGSDLRTSAMTQEKG
jgi:hypothetical protein